MKPRANIYLADPISPEDEKYLLDRSYRLFNVNYPSFRRIIKEITKLQSEVSEPSALVIRSYRKITYSEISLLQKFSIKLVCTLSSGFDNIDISACKEAGIAVINIPTGNFISAAEHTFALILALSKNVINYHNDVTAGFFKSQNYKNFEIKGKTLGIIGVGKVGSLVAEYAHMFGMKVLGNDINKKLRRKYRFIKFVSINSIFRNSDVITVHVPLNDSTRDLINDLHFNLITRKCIFINTSRGEVVNEESLIHAVKSGKLSGAGIDVFKNEPFINKRFRFLKNVILTPHVAGKTLESKVRISNIAARSIHRFFKGEINDVIV